MVQGQGLTPPPYPPKVRVPVPLPHGVGWCGMDIAIGVVNVMPYCKCYGIGSMLVPPSAKKPFCELMNCQQDRQPRLTCVNANPSWTPCEYVFCTFRKRPLGWAGDL